MTNHITHYYSFITFTGQTAAGTRGELHVSSCHMSCLCTQWYSCWVWAYLAFESPSGLLLYAGFNPRGGAGGKCPPQGFQLPPPQAYDTITNPSPALPNVPPQVSTIINFAPLRTHVKIKPCCRLTTPICSSSYHTAIGIEGVVPVTPFSPLLLYRRIKIQYNRLYQEMQDIAVAGLIQKRPKMKASRSLPSIGLGSKHPPKPRVRCES